MEARFEKWVNWLRSLGTLPRVIEEGFKLLGVKEIKGAQSNPKILEFAAELGVEKIYKNDDTSWCALAANAVAKRAGKAIGYKKDPYDLLRALRTLAYGKEILVGDWEVIAISDAKLGDRMIFKRDGGGHDGWYIGESGSHYYIMGGNQNNEFNFTRVAKSRCVGVRRAKYKTGMPATVAKYRINDNGIPITTNEA